MGFKEQQSNRWNDAWWFNAYDSAAKKVGNRTPTSDSDSDSDESGSTTQKIYTGMCRVMT